jgi:hypothetical protein
MAFFFVLSGSALKRSFEAADLEKVPERCFFSASIGIQELLLILRL